MFTTDAFFGTQNVHVNYTALIIVINLLVSDRLH